MAVHPDRRPLARKDTLNVPAHQHRQSPQMHKGELRLP